MLQILKRCGGRSGISLLAALALVAACDDDPAPPFVVEGVGGLEGVVFFDADQNGVFDPAAGDTAVAGANLALRERGTEQALSGGTATSDAGGRFALTGLPPGTHDLFLDTTSVAAGVSFCRNPTPSTIAIGLVRFVSLGARLACLIPIAEAEAMPIGEFVIVRGIVTAAPGQIRPEASYIEDASGGVQLFDGTLLGAGFEIGDRVEVSATVGAFSGEVELLNVTPTAIDKAFATPVPVTVTATDLAAAGSPPTAPLQGRFVVVLQAEQITEFASGGGRNANFEDASMGVMQVRIEVGLVANSGDVATQFPSGKCYNITGVVGSFGGTAQLKPRTLADMEEVPCT